MKLPPWHEVPISKSLDREAFDCGEPALNDFLRRYARKSHELGGAKTFAAVSNTNPSTIFGYYSLSPASIEYTRTPEILKRGLARHEVPAFRLARLAVDKSLQGLGLGGQLLLSAGRRCLLAASEVGGVAILIDAKDDNAASWYKRFGAISLDDTPLTLVLPLRTIAAALQ